jgi:signal transduction histidine kinase
MSISILLFEHHMSLPLPLRSALSRQGYTLVSVARREDVRQALQMVRPAVVVHCERGDVSSLALLSRAVSAEHLQSRIIVLTSRPTMRGAQSAIRSGASEYLGVRERPAKIIAAIQRITTKGYTLSNRLYSEGSTYESLEVQYDMLCEQMRDKDDVISLVSHELRTPLMTISGYLELLKKYHNQLPVEKLNDFIARSQQATDEATHLADLLMQVLHCESGYMAVTNEPIALMPLLRKICEQAEVWHPDHTITFNVSSPLFVWADSVALQQVIGNLLSNAIKYSPEGGTIQIDVSATGRNIEIAVRDEGIGIAQADIDRLFSRFSRVHDQTRWPGIRGTGLGLYLCRHLVVAMGGEIQVTSELGRGSVFTVTLPAANISAGVINSTCTGDLHEPIPTI